MTRSILAAGTAAALSLALAATALGRGDKALKLTGSVGPGFTISLKQNGQNVKSLKAGTYTFVVSDKASIHNFVLEREKGGTFEKQLTSVAFKGTKTATISLGKGEWKYYCKPHEAGMHGEFKVK